MVEECLVKKIKGNTAYIAVVRGAKCQGCKACVFGNKKEIILPAVNDIGCSAGDTVLADIPEREVIAAPFYMYFLPIVMMVAGIVVGGLVNTTFQIILGFALLVLSFVALYFIDRAYQRSKKLAPKLLEILNQGGKNDRP